MKHWLEFLSEAGTILRRAQTQKMLLSEIMAHEKKIKELTRLYEHNEIEISKVASEHWTAEEIAMAKAQSVTTKL